MSLDDRVPQKPATVGRDDVRRGEAPTVSPREELPAAAHEAMDPGCGATMELVVELSNVLAAMKRVTQNKGAPGVDDMPTSQLEDWLRANGSELGRQLLDGTYKPMPVKRVSIPKPNGGTRDLGIPTVVDRFIQQALLQVLQPRIDPTFSPHSYGFRPGRSAHDALRAAAKYVQSRRRVVVDVDLEKFFDRVNHDVLMSRVARHVKDQRILRLIRRFLEAGVMTDGVALTRDEGTPQGGPLSPLLANILLDDVDKVLERDGHCFARYADDLNVYVKSERAGQRVFERLRKLFSALHLRINEEKSAVAKVSTRKFLGCVLMGGGKVRPRAAPESIKRFKARVRQETRPTRGKSFKDVIDGLRRWMVGWRAYFGEPNCDDRDLRELDGWVRRRLRALILRHWRWGRVMYRELLRRGIDSHHATLIARHASSYWANSHTSAMHTAFKNRFFDRLELPLLAAPRKSR